MGKNEEILRQAYAAYAGGDLGAVMRLLAEDCVFKSPGARNRIEHAGEWLGIDGARAFLAAILVDWSFQKLELLEMLAQDDSRFVVRTAVSAIHRRTRSPVSLERIDWVTMRNGQCVSYSEMLDTALLERAVRPR